MLFGRESQQRRIDTLLAAARVGQSGVLVITGEAGIGKSALLGYARGASAGMRVLTLVGTQAEQDLPFAGLGQLLRLAPTELDRLPPPQAQALAVALALREGGGVDRFAIGAGLLTLLTQRSEDRPLCLLIDDAQLVDRPSQEALSFVARRLLADAIAVIIAARPDEPCLLAAGDLPELRLAGLDAGGTRALVRHRAGAAGTPELSDLVLRLSAGNPLAVDELVQERDRLLALPPGAPGPSSPVLAQVYARRAVGLAPEVAAVVLVAAVAGEDLRLISRACARLGLPVAGLAAAEAAGLLHVDGDQVLFSHPLMRSGAYAVATAGRRREMHACIADSIGDADPDRRAWHRCEAGIGPDATLALEMDAVAARAAGRAAYSIAATAAERAATLSTTDALRAARWRAAGTWSWFAGEVARAQLLLTRAAAGEDSVATRVTGQRLLGVIAARCGAVDEARDLLLQAAEDSPDPSETIACYADTINACFYLGDASTALTAAGRLSALLDRAGDDDRVVGLMAAGMARVLAGQGGADLIRDAVQLAQQTGASTADPSPGEGHEAYWLVLGPMFLRDSSSGRDLVQRVADDRRAQSAIGVLPHLLFHLARDEAATDRWGNAEADYHEAIDLARESGQSTELAMSLAGLTWLEARQGRDEETVAHAAETIALCDANHVELGRIWTGFALGDLALGRGDVPESVEHYRAVEDLLARLGVLDVDLSPVPELVEALVRLGDVDAAVPLVENFTARAAAKGQPWAMARAARSQALVSADGQVDETFGRALALHAVTLDAFERARTQLAHGSRLRRARRRVDARRSLRAALETFTKLGARRWAATAADELAATGVSVARPGITPIGQLTPRELQIATLLAQGRTTRQVAGALFLSPKTVEYHLRHIYTKLGIESRTGLRAVLAG